MRDSDVTRIIEKLEDDMMKPKFDFETARREHELKCAAEKQVIDTLLAKGEFLDEDGYPTQDALTIIELWPFEDRKGWFLFIKPLWYLKSFGWAEGEVNHDYIEGKKVYLYEISTAGWSGNEAIIRSMEKNDFLWHLVWVQSRRGGHYQFELDLEDV